MMYNFMVYPLVGSIVGLAELLRERNTPGKWKVNAGKLLMLALPAFFFAYYPYLVYFSGPLQFLEIPISFVNNALVEIQASDYVFQFVFGYFLVSSLDKEEAEQEEQVIGPGAY